MPWETVYEGKEASTKVAALNSSVFHVVGRTGYHWPEKPLAPGCAAGIAWIPHSVVCTFTCCACAALDRCAGWSRTRSTPSGCGLRLTPARAIGAAQLYLPRRRWVDAAVRPFTYAAHGKAISDVTTHCCVRLMVGKRLTVISLQVAPSAPLGLAADTADTGSLHITWQPPATDHGQQHQQPGCL